MTALFNRVSLIALAAATLAACADLHPEYPTDQTAPAPAPAQPSAPAAAAPPPAPVQSQTSPPTYTAPQGGVESTQLPPPPAGAPVYTPPAAPPAPQPFPPPVAAPAPQPLPPPYHRAKPPEPTYVVTVKGEVRAAHDKTREIVMDDGDTIDFLAGRYLTTKAELLKLNKIKKPRDLDAGQKLKVPTPKAYVVESGDTLYSIGKRFNVSADVLAELNNLDPKGHLRSSEEVVLPAGIRDAGPLKRAVPGTGERNEGEYYPPRERPATTYTPPSGGYDATPPVRGQTPPSSLPPVGEVSPPPVDDQVAAAGRGLFVWPVRGDILSAFGPKAGGQTNDGVNIAAPLGTVVQAAAAGVVVYAGDQVPGYGNLVLIKHADGWVTAYAYLSRTTVKIKDQVAQGDEVGEVGQTGGVDLSQLHFEIRYAPTPHDKAKPINPALVLPQ